MRTPLGRIKQNLLKQSLRLKHTSANAPLLHAFALIKSADCSYKIITFYFLGNLTLQNHSFDMKTKLIKYILLRNYTGKFNVTRVMTTETQAEVCGAHYMLDCNIIYIYTFK